MIVLLVAELFYWLTMSDRHGLTCMMAVPHAEFFCCANKIVGL